MARYGKKGLSLVLTLVLLLGLLTGLGMQAAAAELTQYAADGTMTELAEGAKTAAGTYSIADAAELRALSAWVNAGNTGDGFTFFLTADIDLGGKDSPWAPIGQLDGNLGDTDVKAAFFGTFDGQGHSVTGLWVGGDDYTTGAGRYNAANGLFGVNFGTVMNVFAEVEINTYRQGGAIAGVNFGTVKYCASAGSINANGGGGTRGTGGVVGSNYGSVEACCSSAAVHNDYRRAGGIVGYNAKEVADMDAHGTWNSRDDAAHIAAEPTTFLGSISDCFFVGYASSASREYSGGIAASNDAECIIENCYWLDGSSADNWGYYQEAEGATGVFDSEGIVAGSGKSLLEALNNDAFAAGDHFPRLWWARSETGAAEPAEGEEGPAEEEASALAVFGADTALDALKAYETSKTLVKAGKNGETEVEAKGITATDLIEKIGGGSAAATLSLTFTAADGFSAKVDKPEAGWDEVMLLWEGDGASDESLKSAVNYGGGKVWVNGVVTVEAEGGKEVCLTLCLKQGAGEAAMLKEYSKDELLALAEKNEAGWAYLYYKGEAWASIVATEVVGLDALLADAGAAEAWVSSAWLEFTCSDGVYTKSYPSFDDISAKNLFVTETGSSLVPAGLAVTWNTGNLEPVSEESVAALAATAYDSGSLRFVYGIAADQFTDPANTPAGARMPTGVLTLTVCTGEEAPEGTVGTSKNGAVFSDIAGTWAEADILAAAKKGLVNGMGGGLFQPETTLSRAMMAQLLYRVAGESASEGASFGDVTAANWYYAAASWADKNGIAADFAKGSFEGRRDVTREEIAAMLYRYCISSGVDTSARADLSAFGDAGEIHDWAKDAMAWAVAQGIVEGRPGNAIAPAETSTRAEAITMLIRFCRTVLGMEG